MRLRNMVSIYIFHGDKVLLIKKTSSRIFNNPLWCGVGGHFEDRELNSPHDCIMRELYEEAAITESDIKNLTLKYITMRKKDSEIRQQYIYFADLSNVNVKLPECDEGELYWIDVSELKNLEMSFINSECLEHYFNTGKNDGFIYVCSVKSNDGAPFSVFTPVQDFDTAY